MRDLNVEQRGVRRGRELAVRDLGDQRLRILEIREHRARRDRATPPRSLPSERFPAASTRSQRACSAPIDPTLTHIGHVSSRTSSSGLPLPDGRDLELHGGCIDRCRPPGARP